MHKISQFSRKSKLILLATLFIVAPHIHAGTSNNQKGFLTVRIHGQGNSNAQQLIPVTLLNGKQQRLSVIPFLTEYDIQSVYPYRAENGSCGAYLKLNSQGAERLSLYSKNHRGSVIAVMVNGRQAVDLKCILTVNDGVFVIPSGLTKREAGWLGNSFPIIGHENDLPKNNMQFQQQLAWQQDQARRAAVNAGLDQLANAFNQQANTQLQIIQNNPYQQLPVGSGGIPMISRPTHQVTGEITPAAYGQPAQFNGYVQ